MNSKKTLLTLAEKTLTKVAQNVSSSACYWGLYQPEEPECLKEDQDEE